MTTEKEAASTLLEKYADALVKNAEATMEEARDKTADDLIEITGAIEQHGQQVSQLIFDLLAR